MPVRPTASLAVRNAAATAFAAETANWQEHYANEGFMVSESGSREDILGGGRRKAMVDKAIATAKKAIYGAIQEDVTAQMVKVNDSLKMVASAREAVSSPLDFLMNQTLGSSDRAVYSRNLSHAGQTGITSAARQALRNGDKALAAACISAIEALPERSRKSMTISRDDIAEGVIFDEFYESSDKLAVAEFLLAEAELTAREGLGRERTNIDTIALGLKRGAAEEELGRELTPDDTVWKPVVAHVVQSTGDMATTAEAASAKVMAEALELSEQNGRWAEMKVGSDEWIALGKELGYRTGDENDEGNGE